MSTDSVLVRLAKAGRPARPWLLITTNSSWWTRVLIAAGAQQVPPRYVPANADLPEEDHAGTKLTDVNPYRNLAGLNLSRANLIGANLSGRDLSDANLTNANLSRAEMTNANLGRTNLAGANLTAANLGGANLVDANLAGTDLAGTYLGGADLGGADLYWSVNLHRALLVETVWSERTRWPRDQAKAIRMRSEPIGRGQWRVKGSGSTVAEAEKPLVPVS